jgi:Ca2+-binding EF-hand superfamily protein
MKSIVFASVCALLPATTAAEHTVTTQQGKNVLGEITSNVFVHHFTTKEESHNYMGIHLDNTHCVKWGMERVFGEERRCVIVDAKNTVRYKVTIGEATGNLLWQRIDFTGRITKDITTGQGKGGDLRERKKLYIKGSKKKKNTNKATDVATSGGRMLFNWLFGLLDDDESGTIDKNELSSNKFDVLDTNDDGSIDADDFAGLSADTVFKLFDDDNSGYIDSSELPEYLIASIEAHDGDEKNDNKKLNVDEFTKLYDFYYMQHEKQDEL